MERKPSIRTLGHDDNVTQTAVHAMGAHREGGKVEDSHVCVARCPQQVSGGQGWRAGPVPHSGLQPVGHPQPVHGGRRSYQTAGRGCTTGAVEPCRPIDELKAVERRQRCVDWTVRHKQRSLPELPNRSRSGNGPREGRGAGR